MVGCPGGPRVGGGAPTWPRRAHFALLRLPAPRRPRRGPQQRRGRAFAAVPCFSRWWSPDSAARLQLWPLARGATRFRTFSFADLAPGRARRPRGAAEASDGAENRCFWPRPRGLGPQDVSVSFSGPPLLGHSSSTPRPVFDQSSTSPRPVLDHSSTSPRLLDQSSTSPRPVLDPSTSPRPVLDQSSTPRRVLEQSVARAGPLDCPLALFCRPQGFRSQILA